MSKLLVVQVAGLGWELVQNEPGFRKADPVFPALSSVAQASFRTAAAPQRHGVLSNGCYFRELRRVLFWEQSAALVDGERIWKNFRGRGRQVGMLLWEQSLGEELDFVLSPAPIQKRFGGIISDCHAKPHDFYQKLVRTVGREFDWHSYRGGRASRKSSDWIVEATCATLRMKGAPDLLFSCLPHLSYELPRFGPQSPPAKSARKLVLGYLARLQTECAQAGYEFLFYGDGAFSELTRDAVFPNRRLRGAGLFSQRSVREMNYADLFASRAFAMTDQQIAHVFTADESVANDAKAALSALPGVAEVIGREEQRLRGLAHARGGDLILVAEPGTWFAYPWWNKESAAPIHAPNVEIHRTLGYDPCELFSQWPARCSSLATAKVRAAQGRGDLPIAWSSSLDFAATPNSLLDLARLTKAWLEKHA